MEVRKWRHRKEQPAVTQIGSGGARRKARPLATNLREEKQRTTEMHCVNYRGQWSCDMQRRKCKCQHASIKMPCLNHH